MVRKCTHLNWPRTDFSTALRLGARHAFFNRWPGSQSPMPCDGRVSPTLGVKGPAQVSEGRELFGLFWGLALFLLPKHYTTRKHRIVLYKSLYRPLQVSCRGPGHATAKARCAWRNKQCYTAVLATSSATPLCLCQKMLSESMLRFTADGNDQQQLDDGPITGDS
jgi:hypothetical protein